MHHLLIRKLKLLAATVLITQLCACRPANSETEQEITADTTLSSTQNLAFENISEDVPAENTDKLIDDYEAGMRKYIELVNNADETNPELVTEYTLVLEETNRISEKLQSSSGNMSPGQMEKFTKAQAEISKETLRAMK
ncbi:MAG: hypothetical protein V4543_12145 [Bacteroidota bacterium]